MGLLWPTPLKSWLSAVEDIAGPNHCAKGPTSIESIVAAWRQAGLNPGDIVIIAMPNGIGLLEQLFGVIEAGGVPVLISPSCPKARLAEVASSLKARALVAPRLWSRSFAFARAAAIGKASAAILDQEPPVTAASPSEMIILTSGTSGFASGCVFDIQALLLNAERHAQSINLHVGDKIMINLPMYYSFALVAQVFAALVRGVELVIAGPPFHVPTYLSSVIEHQVTVSSLTPVLARTLLQSGRQIPENLRVLTIGGDTLESQSVERLLRQRPDKELYLTYGLAEAGPRVSTLAAHAEPFSRFESVGLPLTGTVVHLDDSHHSNGDKELLVSSETLMKRRIGTIEGRKGDDWRGPCLLATGDLFNRDEDGYLYFKGRLNDFVVRDDEKICLASIRRIANSLPGVVSSQTQVLRTIEGKTDFDLTLLTVFKSEESPENMQRELCKLLRPNELPRNIHVHSATDGAISAFK